MLHRVQSFFLMTKGVDTVGKVCIAWLTISTIDRQAITAHYHNSVQSFFLITNGVDTVGKVCIIGMV